MEEFLHNQHQIFYSYGFVEFIALKKKNFLMTKYDLQTYLFVHKGPDMLLLRAQACRLLLRTNTSSCKQMAQAARQCF